MIKVVPETHKDHKRVPNLNGRSLILIGIPDGLRDLETISIHWKY